jgi:DNA-binding transcriptional ArsR family regulator
MAEEKENIYDALERIFHEPNRLAIMSALCAAGKDGLTFNDLKEACRLTDGNLNRHLKVLEDSEVVLLRKEFVKSKPRTTALLTKRGMQRFQEYLQALGEVLKQARTSAVPARAASFAAGLPVRAKA